MAEFRQLERCAGEAVRRRESPRVSKSAPPNKVVTVGETVGGVLFQRKTLSYGWRRRAGHTVDASRSLLEAMRGGAGRKRKNRGVKEKKQKTTKYQYNNGLS